MVTILCAVLPAVQAFAGYTERVSVSSAGVQADGSSESPSVSGDGRFVAFDSNSDNLVPGVTDGQQHVFVRDRAAGTTECASLDSSGEPILGWGARLSSDGRYVAFQSFKLSPGGQQRAVAYVRDREDGVTELASMNSAGEEIEGDSWLNGLSGDARCVLLAATAPNLEPGVLGGLYVRDRLQGTTELVSVDSAGRHMSGGGDGADISADGRLVAWAAQEDAPPGAPGVWLGLDIRDRLTNQTDRVGGIGTGATQLAYVVDPSISADGRFVAFECPAAFLSPTPPLQGDQIFLFDRVTCALAKVGLSDAGEEANWNAFNPVVSADGRFVAFWAEGMSTSDLLVRDRIAGRTQRVSVNDSGQSAASADAPYSMSADGRVVAFDSARSDVVPGDTNDQPDVFAYDRLTFSDVPVDFWAYYDIEGCLNGGVVSRATDRLFHPSEAVTRDVMASFIARAMAGGDAQVPEGPATPSFPDVPPDYWAYKYVEYARAHGIVTGYRDGLYHPERTVDRGQMAVFVARAMVGGDAYVPRQVDRPVYFADIVGSLNSEYYKYVEFLVQEGIVKGYPDRLYHPELTCTKDQIAVFLARAFKLPI
jgi:hypothetical protein